MYYTGQTQEVQKPAILFVQDQGRRPLALRNGHWDEMDTQTRLTTVSVNFGLIRHLLDVEQG